ncbi:hypothetical protein BH10BAC2_BH10BAC2_39740 [soil metagenome]
MMQNIISITVNPLTVDGPVHLTAEIFPTNELHVFLVKEVSFQKNWNTVPFMSAFYLEKRQVDKNIYWFNKDTDRSTLISQAIGIAIDENFSSAGIIDTLMST